jgi:hypothetical protein
VSERDNEDNMILTDENFEKMIKSVKNKLGTKPKNSLFGNNLSQMKTDPMKKLVGGKS